MNKVNGIWDYGGSGFYATRLEAYRMVVAPSTTSKGRYIWVIYHLSNGKTAAVCAVPADSAEDAMKQAEAKYATLIQKS